MKAPIVALAATAAGFAAASAYLYGELSVERVRTQAEVEARSKLEARSRLVHDSIQLGGAQAQASVLPFSQIRDSRFMSPEGEAPALAASLSPPPADDPQSLPQTEVLLRAERTSDVIPGTLEKIQVHKSADPLEFDPREERAPASRLARRLMRERNTLPDEPASH